jgi:hypothetical protein
MITRIALGFPISLSNSSVSLFDDGKNIPISVSFSADIFSGECSASVSYFEPLEKILSGTSLPWHFGGGSGGKWILTINGIQSFVGLVTNTSTRRSKGNNYIRTINFRGIIKKWDVPCVAKIYPTGASEESPSLTKTMSDVLQDIVNDVVLMSGVHLDGDIPHVDTLVSTMYEKKVLTISNSTYLSEIQRLASYLGRAVFQHPSKSEISMSNILFPSESVTYVKERCSGASFDVNFETIPGTVLVADDVTNKANSYGFYGEPSDDTNYQFTGSDDLAYASTIGIASDHLIDIAHQLFDVGRCASQVLRFKYAGLPPQVDMLGKMITWQDAAGLSGTPYVISKFTTNYVKTSIWTEIEAYVKPAVTAVVS